MNRLATQEIVEFLNVTEPAQVFQQLVKEMQPFETLPSGVKYRDKRKREPQADGENSR